MPAVGGQLVTPDPASGVGEALELLGSAGVHPVVRCFPHGALIVFDHDLRYLAAGGLGLAEVGLSRELLEGHTIDEVFPAEVVAVIAPFYRAALRGEESTMDVPYAGRIFLQRLGPLRDAGGAVIAGMGFTQDVTAAREAQRALQASQTELREERRRLEEAQAIGRVGSWEYNLLTGVLTWSDAMLGLYGLKRGAFGGDYSSALEQIHPADRGAVDAATAHCLATGADIDIRYRVTRADDGQLRWFDARGRATYDGDVMVRLVGAVADVTEQVIAERDTRDAQAFYDAVLTASPDLTMITDLTTGRVIYGSRDEGLLGLTTRELTLLSRGERVARVHPEDQARLQAADVSSQALRDGEVLELRYRGRHTDGTWHWMDRRVTPFRRGETGAVTQVLGVTRDVTDMVRAEERLSHAALHDPLTGLPNRALLIDRLTSALARASRKSRDVAVLFCDLDGFKRVNDTYGHASGDAVLIEVARRVSGALREQDTVARVGGDEFVLLLEPWNRPAAGDTGPGTPAAGSAPLTPTWPVSATLEQLALQVATRIAAALRRPIVVNGIEHVVTASIGISIAGLGAAAADGTSAAGSRGLTAEEIVQDADVAMYRAKKLGKDRAEVFHCALRADVTERGRVEHLLREALAGAPGGPTLRAVYQPIVDQTGAWRGVEALARLTDAGGRAIVPDVFIPTAEDTGQINDLGRLMLDLATAQLAAWRRGRPDLGGLTMAVNISAVQAQRGTLEQDVREALVRHALKPRDLVLELTETTLLAATQSTMSALQRLREDGIGIAIDDFGTGYASLRYLTTLPVTAVKVDRSFTAGLPADRTSDKIVKAVAGLAAELGLACIVEGVETEQQRDALPAGVQLQGWLIGHPMSADMFAPMLGSWGPRTPVHETLHRAEV